MTTIAVASTEKISERWDSGHCIVGQLSASSRIIRTNTVNITLQKNMTGVVNT